MWTILKYFTEFVTIFCFMFWFLGLETCRILAPQPGIANHRPCIGRRSLNHWTTREVPFILLILEENNFIDDVYCAMKFLYSIHPSSKVVHLDRGKSHSR